MKQTQKRRMVLRLIRAGKKGLTTYQLFSDLACCKYTSRISELREDGHCIEAQACGNIGGKKTSQYRYRYVCYRGQELPPAISDALRAEGYKMKKHISSVTSTRWITWMEA